MNTRGQTICLSMIVKNEAPVIGRCLASVRPIIDHWVIVDTGSTDGTQDVIRGAMGDLPGELHERPWRDFACNRTEALDLARPRGDYVLIIDADDVLEFEPGFRMPTLQTDSYKLRITDMSIVYERPQIVRSVLPWRWRGVLHEFLTCDEAQMSETLSGIWMRRNHDGARRRDTQTYRRDAAVLEAALRAESDPFMLSRYRFYLAQSYRDCGEKPKAVEHYLARGEMGFWDEEVFVSLLVAARLMEELGRPFEEVLATYERASASCPRRAEALHGASKLCFRNGRNREGYEIAARGLDLPLPGGGLFVEPWIYQYGLLDEYAVNAYWTGACRDCLDACLKLLGGGRLPGDQRGRVADNARFALQGLPKEPNLGSAGAADFVEQHVPGPARPLRSRLDAPPPRVLLAVLAKQKEKVLPAYLKCIEALDYPKSAIVLYVRTNNNIDGTERILHEWVERIGHLYAGVEFDAEDVVQLVQRYGVHEWNPVRFRVLGRIRNISLRKTLDHGCAFYFVADVDNLVRPCTLRELVALDLPIAAPFLRAASPGAYYSNYHAEVDANGYYAECDQYRWAAERRVRGVIEMPVVHCTYLVRADVIPELTYEDGTDRHEYVVFSDSARRAGILQYLDNRQVYGYITFDEDADAERVPFHTGETSGQVGAVLALIGADSPGQDRLVEGSRAWAKQEISSAPRLALGTRQKTLIFCTAFARTESEWNGRYRRWLEAIRASELDHDALLIVDDGSPVLPDWKGTKLVTNAAEADPTACLSLFHFPENLGRKAIFDFPGWLRSFALAGRYAQRHGFEKVVHLESDSFLIGQRVQNYVNAITEGWVALWCPRHRMPESAIQIIAGPFLDHFAALSDTHPHEAMIGKEFELQLPFSHVEKGFIGDRYGEYLSFVPGHAEYAVNCRTDSSEDYYWWLTHPARK